MDQLEALRRVLEIAAAARALVKQGLASAETTGESGYYGYFRVYQGRATPTDRQLFKRLKQYVETEAPKRFAYFYKNAKSS